MFNFAPWAIVYLKKMAKIDPQEKLFYNALNLASENNFALLTTLKKCYRTFRRAWDSDQFPKTTSFHHFESETIKKFFEKKSKIKPDQEWQKLQNLGVELILSSNDNYPLLLKEINSYPLALYQLGHYFEKKPRIAVVGTRRASPYGKTVVEKIVKELVRAGVTVVSGLAYGIDTFSHIVALGEGGETVAVLGAGLDIIFPASNKKLAEKIIKHGALISEYSLGTPPLKHHFPARNRIISGLSLGTLIIEAPLQSGALITGRFALEQNREVFAVPGPIFSKNSEGANELIKSGAKLVSKIEDILLELNLPLGAPQPIELKNLTPEEQKLLEIVRKAERPIGVDEIIAQSEMEASLVNQNLTFLELKNLIKLDSGGYRIKF